MKSATALAILLSFLLGVPTAAVAGVPDPVCGDVNDSGSVNSTDALLVLKKGVGQDLELSCSAYESEISTCTSNLASTSADLGACTTSLGTCSSDLGTCTGDLDDCDGDLVICDTELGECNADLDDCLGGSSCGDGTVDDGEDCEAFDLDGETCASLGFEGGSLRCAAGCVYETIDCYASRYDASGDTVLDRETGLEWEKKTTEPGSGENYDDPHDIDNTYSWCAESGRFCANPAKPFDGTAATDFLARLNGTSDGVCYLGHCDWRLPTREELETIAALPCGSPPCVTHPALLPMREDGYFSASTSTLNAETADGVQFKNGNPVGIAKALEFYVRAVRGGP